MIFVHRKMFFFCVWNFDIIKKRKTLSFHFAALHLKIFFSFFRDEKFEFSKHETFLFQMNFIITFLVQSFVYLALNVAKYSKSKAATRSCKQQHSFRKQQHLRILTPMPHYAQPCKCCIACATHQIHFSSIPNTANGFQLISIVGTFCFLSRSLAANFGFHVKIFSKKFLFLFPWFDLFLNSRQRLVYLTLTYWQEFAIQFQISVSISIYTLFEHCC